MSSAEFAIFAHLSCGHVMGGGVLGQNFRQNRYLIPEPSFPLLQSDYNQQGFRNCKMGIFSPDRFLVLRDFEPSAFQVVRWDCDPASVSLTLLKPVYQPPSLRSDAESPLAL